MPSTIEMDIASLFNSERFSDMTIYCGDRKWFAHKLVMCMQSDFFKKACEGKFKEAETGRVDLDDDDPDIVHALLTYIYKSDYDVVETTGADALIFHIKVFALAEKLFVPSLLDHASLKFRNAVFEDLNNGQWNHEHILSPVTEWDATTTDPHNILGHRIADVIMDRPDEFLYDEKTSPWFHKVLARIPWLGAEIARRVYAQFREANSIRTFRCKDCEQIFMAKVECDDRGHMSCPNCEERKLIDLDDWVTRHEIYLALADWRQDSNHYLEIV